MLNLKRLSSRWNTSNKFHLNKQINRMFSVIGLDMGGTNTCIAIMEANGPRVVENAEGLRTTPSIVSENEDGSLVVAVAAKRQAIQNLNNSYYGTKFFFGRKYSDEFVQNMLKRFPFKISKGPNDEIQFLNDKGKVISPRDVTSGYIKYVKDQAEALTGKPIKKVVMTVPKYVNNTGKTELTESFKDSGLDIVEFMDESAAAGYAYNLDKNEKVKNFLVFNFSGLDFSLVYMSKKPVEDKKAGEGAESSVMQKDLFEIKTESYDFNLGGEDIDKTITDFLLFQFKQQNKMDISQDLQALQRVREAAEQSKIELTLSQQVEINLPFLAANETGPKHLSTRISRSKFESLADSLFSKVRANCEKFLKENNIKKEEIDDIILVGGASRIPRVQEIIKQVFGREPNKNLNPEEASAMGASILASTIKASVDELKNLDKLPLSIGIETLGDTFTRIIPKDTMLPFKIRKTFTTVFDNEPRINLKFFFGERDIASENKPLGDISMVIPLTEKGLARIAVTFNLNTNGDLTISAQEEMSKKSTSYSTKINSGLTQDIVNDVIEISAKFKDSDRMKIELNELKIEADNFIYTLTKLIKENRDTLTTNNLDLESVENNMEELNSLLTGEEYEKIVKSYEALQSKCKDLQAVISKQGKKE